MRLIFFWSHDFGEERGRLYPHCKPDGSDTNLLCTQLEDDGGVGIDSFSPWISEAIEKIDAVRDGYKSEEIWGTEVLCTDITANEVKIYFSDEVGGVEYYKLSAFRSALVGWLEFIQSEPDINKSIELEI